MSHAMSGSLVEEEARELLDLALDAIIQARLMLMRPRAISSVKLLDEMSLADLKQELVRERYRGTIDRTSLPCIKQTGKKGARILMRLLEDPGRFVSHQALAEAAQLRSQTSSAIKVYVCQIRKSLEEYGYSPKIIETGRGAYRIRPDKTDEIIEFLHSV
jgi:DNA-binding response OmpR family regulator